MSFLESKPAISASRQVFRNKALKPFILPADHRLLAFPFDRKPDIVLKEIEEDFIQEKMSFMSHYLKDDNPDQLAKLFEAILSNRELSLVLFGRNGAPQFTERIKEMVRPGVLVEWQKEFPHYKRQDLEYVFEFVFPGAMNLILRQLSGESNLTIPEFARRLDCLGHYCHLAIRQFQ